MTTPETPEIARLRAQINESEKWRLAVQATCDTFQQQIRRLQGEAEQAEAQIAALTAALQAYGKHTFPCRSSSTLLPTDDACSCGLDAVLASLPAAPPAQQTTTGKARNSINA